MITHHSGRRAPEMTPDHGKRPAPWRLDCAGGAPPQAALVPQSDRPRVGTRARVVAGRSARSTPTYLAVATLGPGEWDPPQCEDFCDQRGRVRSRRPGGFTGGAGQSRAVHAVARRRGGWVAWSAYRAWAAILWHRQPTVIMMGGLMIGEVAGAGVSCPKSET